MIETRDGILHIGGIPVTRLAEKYSDPLYAYDGGMIEARLSELKSALPRGVEIIYSMKANPNASIVALLSDMADGVDVSSLREMQVALRAGFTADRVFFVGPSKSAEEVEEAIQAQIGCLVVESEEELKLADQIAGRLGKSVDVALRVNPAFDSAGSKLKMGGGARQFGIDEEQIAEVISSSRSLTHVAIIGLHAYVGTRIMDWAVALRNTQEILDLALEVQQTCGLQLRLVDVGGGFGVPYFPGEQSFDFQRFAEAAAPVFSQFQSQAPGVRVVMELGRFIVGEAGVYVTGVRYVKTSRGQKYALVSGGMNHHQATTSVGSFIKHNFPIAVLNKMNVEAVEPVFVCGPLCTPSDVLGRSVDLPPVEVGDLIGILRSGAYGLTASPLEFLSHRWPSEVLVYDGVDYLVRRPPELEDVLKTQPIIFVKTGVTT